MSSVMIPDYEYGPRDDEEEYMPEEEWITHYCGQWDSYRETAKKHGVILPESDAMIDDPRYRYEDSEPRAAATEDVRILFNEILAV